MDAFPTRFTGGAGRLRACFRGVEVSALESRRLLSANGAGALAVDAPAANGSSIAYRVAADTGSGASTMTAAGGGAVAPLDALPILHSDPAAPAMLYLDFTGAAAQPWGSYQVPATPAYDTDGDPSTFSQGELANIRQIWARVAEKFSPFNLDVTTQDPGSYPPGKVVRAVIGGNGAWDPRDSGGVSYVGGFTNGPTSVWIFPGGLTNGNPHDVAEAVSHEAGHAFGLVHQSIWNGSTLANEYNPGIGATAPIMGRSYDGARGVWWRGADSNSAQEIQDDMSIIASPINGFGYRPQDHGQSIYTADNVTLTGSTFSTSGIIETTADNDFFKFTTGAGAISLQADVAQYGPTLDLKLQLFHASGAVVASADTASLGESITTTVPAGTYYIAVASHGSYGDVGQYTLKGSVFPPPVTPPQQAIAPVPSQSIVVLPPTPIVARARETGASVPTSASAQSPEDLTATAAPGRKVLLTWTALADPRTRYIIERSTDGRTWTRLTTVSRGAAHFIDAHISRPTYTYRLSALGAHDAVLSNAATMVSPPRKSSKALAVAHWHKPIQVVAKQRVSPSVWMNVYGYGALLSMKAA